MTDLDAQAHLRAIRQLMERATYYRAISAPTALTGGLLSLGTAAGQLLHLRNPPGGVATGRADAAGFVLAWGIVFLLTAAANAVFIWRGARGRGEPLVSPAMKLALAAIAPAVLAGALVGWALTLSSGLPLLPALFWVIFYGLGLLATLPFAPRSLVALGWAFLLTGLTALIYFLYQGLLPSFDLPTPTTAYAPALMGATFGGYHVVYALCVWPRRARTLEAVERRPLVSSPSSSSETAPPPLT